MSDISKKRTYDNMASSPVSSLTGNSPESPPISATATTSASASAAAAAAAKRQHLTDSATPNSGHSTTIEAGVDTEQDDIQSKASRSDSIEVVTVDDKYDMTLVVGTQERGIKKIQINSGSLRMASAPFKAMLSGQYVESSKAEIEFPDDSPDTFLLVLRLLHHQFAELPDELSHNELEDLAVFCDKYLLADVIKRFEAIHNWVIKIRGIQPYWQQDAKLQDSIYVAHLLDFAADRDYLINALAFNVAIDKGSGKFYYMWDGEQIVLREDLPDSILDQVNKTRRDLLTEMVEKCDAALQSALHTKTCINDTEKCITQKIGILVMEFHKLGLYPVPRDSTNLCGSVLSYWKAFLRIRTKHTWGPAEASQANGKCAYVVCMGDLDLEGPLCAAFRKHTHHALLKTWTVKHDTSGCARDYQRSYW